MKELRDELIRRLDETLPIQVSELMQSALKDLEQDRYGNYGKLLDSICDKIAKRFVEENFEKISSMIDLQRVAKMAEFAAIGKSFGQ